MKRNLLNILLSINWQQNIQTSLSNQNILEVIDASVYRLAIWANQLEQADFGNPALCFIREMQNSIQHSSALIGLCLYKPSAASSRTFLESCVYYTYFRTHLEELSTLVSDSKYFTGKTEIIEYHKIHTKGFKSKQAYLNLIGRLDTWYSHTSSVVHGQIPGTWNTHSDLAQTSYVEAVQIKALEAVTEGASLVNDLLLCTVTDYLWSSFSSEAKIFLTKGMTPAKREALKIDIK
jgi:hypothetical protein